MKTSGLYDEHELVGAKIRTLRDVVFADGSIVPRGSVGQITSVLPSTNSLVYETNIVDHGCRVFDKDQFVIE